MGLLRVFLEVDGAIARIEKALFGWISADVWLLVGRIILGLSLIMNGVGQAMGELVGPEKMMSAMMTMRGVSLDLMWPAILVSFLGGWAILLGWRIRTTVFLVGVYSVVATVMFHGTFMGWENKQVMPPFNLEACRAMIAWDKLPPASDEFVKGCAYFRTMSDMFSFQKHFTMLLPALMLLMAGAGRFSVDGWTRKKRDALKP